jgi:mycothiol system anti-sigma-R factor
MSCGNPHDTPCDDVLQAVYAYIDGEMTAEDHHVIRHHLDECSPCLRQYGIEQEVKALVARCCGSEVAPEQLRAKVVARLAQVRVQITHLEYRID